MITSKENELIKHIKALNQKKYREECKEYYIEGVKQIMEAIENNVSIVKIIICGEMLGEKVENIEKYDVEYTSPNVFKYISDTESPQGILAVVKQKPQRTISNRIVFALSDIQDPGNLGTILRTLDAAGLHDIILSENTVEAYNPKAVRSTMGAIYRVNPIKSDNLIKDLLQLKEEGYKIIVTDLDTDKKYYDINFEEKCVIVIGNESQGVSKDVKDIADYKVKIPMIGKTESLNAAVASSIIMYEYVRKMEK